MQCESNAVRAEANQTTGGETLLDGHELDQEQLYVAARLGRIDRACFADIARKMQRENGECNYLTWLIKRHPDIPSVDSPPKIGGRELRRARVTWQAKAKGRRGKPKISKIAN